MIHYRGDTELALKTIEEAIQHTPTIIELYSAKGRFYKVLFLFIFKK